MRSAIFDVEFYNRYFVPGELPALKASFVNYLPMVGAIFSKSFHELDLYQCVDNK